MKEQHTEIQVSVADAVRERVTQLKAIDAATLAELPERSTQQLIIQGVPVTISVWHDRLDETSLRIVVQAYRPGLLIGRMQADGFVLTKGGEIRPLSQDEWAPFG